MLFTFKTGAIKSAETWFLSDRLLTSPQDKRIDLRSVKKARFFQVTHQDMYAVTLILKTEGDTVSIGCNDGRYTDNKKQCLMLMMAVLAILEEENPSLRVSYGADKTMRYILTGMWLSLCPMAIWGIVSIMQTMDNPSLGYPLIGVVVIAAIAFVFFSAPWKDLVTLPPAAIENTLMNHAGLKKEALPRGQ